MPHLWEIETHWFYKTKQELGECTFRYKSWKEFTECKPYRLWKPYILSSWSWKTLYPKDFEVQKRNDAEKAVMDCRKMLRVNPSIYDLGTPIPEAPSPEGVEMLQIVFLSPERISGVHRVEIHIEKENEEKVREWLESHMPKFWKLE